MDLDDDLRATLWDAIAYLRVGTFDEAPGEREVYERAIALLGGDAS